MWFIRDHSAPIANQNWVLPVCKTCQNICLIRYSYGLRMTLMSLKSSVKRFIFHNDGCQLDMWGFMADMNMTIGTPRCGEQIEATSSPEKTPCRLVGREHYRKLSTKPSCSYSQNVSSMCFYNLKQWLEFQCVPPNQNSCHSLRKSDCRFDVKLIIIFSMRHSLSSL